METKHANVTKAKCRLLPANIIREHKVAKCKESAHNESKEHKYMERGSVKWTTRLVAEAVDPRRRAEFQELFPPTSGPKQQHAGTCRAWRTIGGLLTQTAALLDLRRRGTPSRATSTAALATI